MRNSHWIWALSLTCAAGTALGQTPTRPAPTTDAAPTVTPVATPAATPPAAPPAPTLPAEFTARPGGLTANGAAARAIRTSLQVRAALSNTEAAEAQRAEAGRSLIPQVVVSARYTRLSEITQASLGSPVPTPILFGNQGVACVQTDGTVGPSIRGCANGLAGQPLQNPGGGFSFPVILNQFVIHGSVTVPLSDLIFRLARVYEGAGLMVQARRLDEEALRIQVGADTRVAFYEYLRARGQAAVAHEGLEAARRHREDLARFVEAGTVARVELFRVEAQAAESERLSVLAENGVSLAEAQLRQRMHATPDETFTLGESLEEPVDLPTNLDDMIRRARHDRPEVASLERQSASLEESLSATRAALWPSLAGVFNVDIANPNQRFVPQTQDFNTTWDASLQLSWSPTGALVSASQASRLSAQRDALQANIAALREGIELEVRSAFVSAQGARASIESTRRQLVASEESYRVRRERFLAGSAVSTDLTDAEVELVRARLALVNAHVDLREALARLRRALGEREATAS